MNRKEIEYKQARAAGVDFALAGWGTQRTDIPARRCLQTPRALLDLL